MDVQLKKEVKNKNNASNRMSSNQCQVYNAAAAVAISA